MKVTLVLAGMIFAGSVMGAVTIPQQYQGYYYYVSEGKSTCKNVNDHDMWLVEGDGMTYGTWAGCTPKKILKAANGEFSVLVECFQEGDKPWKATWKFGKNGLAVDGKLDKKPCSPTSK